MRYVGYEEDGRIRGYFTFRFVKGSHSSFIDNHISMFIGIYGNPEVLSELLTFLHSQFDQIDLIRLRTFDSTFHHLLKDPRNSSRDLFPPVYHQTHKCGTGIMYRVVDSRRFFELLSEHSFGDQTCRLKLTIVDSFMPENDGSLLLHFDEGKPRLEPEDADYDVELTMDIADFSSLAMGAVDLKSLYRYGLVQLSDLSYLDRLHRLFATDRPICMTSF